VRKHQRGAAHKRVPAKTCEMTAEDLHANATHAVNTKKKTPKKKIKRHHEAIESPRILPVPSDMQFVRGGPVTRRTWVRDDAAAAYSIL
jgi:hypothetical protein